MLFSCCLKLWVSEGNSSCCLRRIILQNHERSCVLHIIREFDCGVYQALFAKSAGTVHCLHDRGAVPRCGTATRRLVIYLFLSFLIQNYSFNLPSPISLRLEQYIFTITSPPLCISFPSFCHPAHLVRNPYSQLSQIQTSCIEKPTSQTLVQYACAAA
jgi:hypothetical protein